jgi:glycosyltransferase involved in cell wall biosynthesis
MMPTIQQAPLFSCETSADSTSRRSASASASLTGAGCAAALRRTTTALIIEPNFTGHRWRYAQWCAQAFEEAGFACIIATASSNQGHPLVREIVQARKAELQIAFVDTPSPASAIAAQAERVSYLRYHRYFAHAFERVTAYTPASIVVVPYVDYFLYALPFLGSPFGDAPWIGITMRATFHHRQVGVKAPDRPLVNAVKAQLFRHALRARALRTMLSIDPTLTEWSDAACARAAAGVRTHAPVAYLADPFPDAHAEDQAVARSRLQFGPGRYLLVYGAITDRKGIRELVAALERMERAPTLVVAGEQDESTRAFLRAHAPRLAPEPVIIDRFIADDLERDLFSACDIVWLGYRGHYGMSGVLVQAYRFGKRVVATPEGLIGWFCAGGMLGPVLDDLSPEAIARGIEAASAETGGAGARTITGSHGALLARNTLNGFKRTLLDAAAEPACASASSFGT